MGVFKNPTAHAGCQMVSDACQTNRWRYNLKTLANKEAEEKRKWHFTGNGSLTTMAQHKKESHVWTDIEIELLLGMTLE